MELAYSTHGHLALLTALTADGVSIKPAKDGVTVAKFADGSLVTGELSAARAIARVNSLLGCDTAAAAEVDEWLEALATHGCVVDGTSKYEAYLGYALSLADIAIALTVKAHNVTLDGVNSKRWFATVGELVPFDKLEAALGAVSASSLPWGSSSAPVALSRAESSALTNTSATKATAASKEDRRDNKADAASAKAKALVADKANAKEAKGAAATGAKASTTNTSAAPSKNIGGGGSMGSMPRLIDAEMGKVVTRFPPEPSGYLHIGHVKALLLNDFYASAYNGSMIVRFDDTNPSKEKEEYEENILKDIKALGVKFVSITHTSDYFDVITEHARRLIDEGKAFMDDTPREVMQQERNDLVDSKRRNESVAVNKARFELMLKGGEEGAPWCLRAKMNMQDPNGTCRDPVLFRCNETPHHRTGTKYKAYPTYDLACPIVDSLEGVTHALRSSEYHDRDVQYYRLIDMLGIRKVFIQDFARLNFVYTLLSKRKLTWFVDNKHVDGWYDPRFPTVQGMLRRGCTVPALREFILSQGASKRQIEMEWDKFWAINKKYLDPVAPRYTALPRDGLVRVSLTNGPAAPEYRTQPLHPKNPAVGTKAVLYTPAIFLDIADVAEMKENEEITLMKWGNAFIRAIQRDAHGKIVGATGELNPTGDVKKTEKKVTWLPDSPSNVNIVMSEFDYLITKENLQEGDDFEAAINPVTRIDTPLIGEPAMRLMQANDIIQVERKGFFRCDRAFLSEDRPASLFLIPDGKVKGLFNLKDRVKTASAAAKA